MERLIMDDLARSAQRFPDKVAFADSKRSVTFAQLADSTARIATAIIREGIFKQPIAVFMDKSVECIEGMLSVSLSGNFYTILDTQMPEARVAKILETLAPAAILTTDAYADKVASFFAGKVLRYEALTAQPSDAALLSATRERIVDTDVMYVLFTSGSTGVPKGVVIPHKAVKAYLDWGTDQLGLDETTVFGNQTPFYFVMSGFDILQTVRNGCTMYIVPKMLFSFPLDLLTYLKERKVNTLFWVPSALCLIANFRALPEVHLDDLRMVMFGGEVMPSKQLNQWIREYPDVTFINAYGPTEMTDITNFYVVNRPIEDTEMLPIGEACRHMDMLILDENDHPAKKGEMGELCGRGPSLAYGYYNAPDKTREAFVQNPLQSAYPEMIYRTGDLVRYNERGELIYVCRKDFQIKHMGNRIELGEIEVAVSAAEGVAACCCLYDADKKQIVLIYTGDADEAFLREKLPALLPVYMMPNRYHKLDAMPINLNGKIDRAALKTQYITR